LTCKDKIVKKKEENELIFRVLSYLKTSKKKKKMQRSRIMIWIRKKRLYLVILCKERFLIFMY